jgi:hypothetical protein
MVSFIWLIGCSKDDDKKAESPVVDYRSQFVGNYQFQVVYYSFSMGGSHYDTVETDYPGSISLDEDSHKVVIRYRDGENKMGCALFGAWINPTVTINGQLDYIGVMKKCTHHSLFSHPRGNSTTYPEITADSVFISIGSGSNGAKYGQRIYGARQ